MSDRLDEIRKLLADATDDQGIAGTVSRVSVSGGLVVDVEPFWVADAEILANAPELLEWAVGEIERLRAAQSLVSAWAQTRVYAILLSLHDEGASRSALEDECKTMRGVVALMNGRTPAKICTVTGQPHKAIVTCVDCDWDRQMADGEGGAG